jgi:hypothetical protein
MTASIQNLKKYHIRYKPLNIVLMIFKSSTESNNVYMNKFEFFVFARSTSYTITRFITQAQVSTVQTKIIVNEDEYYA